MSFVTNIFKPVVNWVTGATNDIIGAITGAALKGAVYGAVIGAAQSAITGGDIKKGALRGAAAGGVFAGVASSLAQMAGTSGYSAPEQLEKMGYTDSKTAQQEVIEELGDTEPIKTEAGTGTPVTEKYSQTKPPEEKKNWWDISDDEKGKVYSGILGGVATGAGNYLAAKEKADSDKELLNYKANIERQKVIDNKPSKNFNQKSVNIKMRHWWEERAK